MDKTLSIQLNGNRKVSGILRGYDQFMNLVIDNAIEEVSPQEKNNIGMVVSFHIIFVLFLCVYCFECARKEN